MTFDANSGVPHTDETSLKRDAKSILIKLAKFLKGLFMLSLDLKKKVKER